MNQAPTRDKAATQLLWEVARVRPCADAVKTLVDRLDDPGRAVALATTHGLGGLMWRAVRAAGCDAALGPSGQVLARHAGIRRSEELLLLPLAMRRAVGPLVAAGMEPVVFKGGALAARYPEPGLREMADVDLLLPPSQYSGALDVLTAAGWEVARGAGRSHHEAALVHPEVPGLPVELHRDLSVWYQRNTGLRAVDLWRHRIPLECFGEAAFGLPAEVELVALAAHAGKPYHCFDRLIWASDTVVVADAAAASGHPLDWDRVQDLAEQWRCRTVVAVALAQGNRLGLAAPAALVRIRGTRIRQAAVQPLLGSDWPVESQDGRHRNRLPYALADDPSRRLALFVGAPAPRPPAQWPGIYAQEIGYALRRAWRLWRSVTTVSASDAPRLVVLGVLFAVAEGLVRSVPLPAAGRWFGAPLATTPAEPAPVDPWPALDVTTRRWLRLAGGIGRRWPFGRGGCLRQALVEGWVLRRYRPALRVGVASGTVTFAAHAWIELDGHRRPEDAGFAPLDGSVARPW